MIAYTTATAIFWLGLAIIIPIVRWAIQRHRTRDIRRMLNGDRKRR
jgi:hypothetical protein